MGGKQGSEQEVKGPERRNHTTGGFIRTCAVTNPDFLNVPKAPVVFSVTDTCITVQFFFQLTSNELALLENSCIPLCETVWIPRGTPHMPRNYILESDHLKHRLQIS